MEEQDTSRLNSSPDESQEHASPQVTPLLDSDEIVVDGLVIKSPSEPTQVYGDDDVRLWDVNALGRPAARSRRWGIIDFGQLTGDWLVSAKDLALILLNPEHPRLRHRQIPIRQEAADPSTVSTHIRALKEYFDVARWQGFPADLRTWTETDFAEAVARIEALKPVSEQALRTLERVPRLLFALRDLISHAPSMEPWPTAAGSPFEGRFQKKVKVRTEPVDPDLYFSLLDSAMAYVDVFSIDIIRGLDNVAAGKQKRSVVAGAEVDSVVMAYLDDPNSTIPMKSPCTANASPAEWDVAINWQLLSILTTGRNNSVFNPGRPEGRVRRARAVQRARHGAAVLGGTTAPTAHLPGQPVPWIDHLSLTQLQNEMRYLRTACYIVIASLTMMRDSEVQALQRGALTTFAGLPAVKSSLIKGNDEPPTMYWWVTDPVERAVQVAERISMHSTQLFASSRTTKGNDAGGIYINHLLPQYRNRINETAERRGLTPIGDGKITPHMLRRTMALITEWERGGQVAAARQLKHAFLASRSNSLTGAYTAPTERWAEELRERKAEHSARQALDDLALGIAPAGPGANRMTEVLNAQGTVLDQRARARFLAAKFPDLQIGTANVCLGDHAVAQCLPPDQRDGSVPIRATMCDPTRCANSVVLPLQRQLWSGEERSLRQMRQTPRLSPHARALLDDRLADVRRITEELS